MIPTSAAIKARKAQLFATTSGTGTAANLYTKDCGFIATVVVPVVVMLFGERIRRNPW